MNVYVLTHGEYSDYKIVGMYSTREKAEEAREFLPSSNEIIEEFALDVMPSFEKGTKQWVVCIDESGEVVERWSTELDDLSPGTDTRCLVCLRYMRSMKRMIVAQVVCYCTDSEMATKIAREQWAQAKARGEFEREKEKRGAE